jgi:DNA-binding HxlR family transcriptional regulator
MEDSKEKLKEEIRKMVRDVVKETMKEVMEERKLSFRVEIPREELEYAEPTASILRDISYILRESIRKSIRERGEIAVEEMILNLPELKAVQIIKSLGNEDRIKILKLVYSSPRSFTELKEKLGLESSSLTYNLKYLINTGLIRHNLRTASYEITQRGITLLKILALIYETLGGEAYE